MHRWRSSAFFVWTACTCAAAYGQRVQEPDSFPKQPPVGPLPRPAALPKSQSAKLDNGIEVIVVSNSEIPWVSVGWYLMSGAKFDPPEKSGLASVTAAMLRKGTASHSDAELAELLDYHAVSLAADASHHTTTVSAGGPSKELELAVQCIAEVVRTPTFPAKEYRQHIEQTLAGMAIAERDGGYLADREFNQRLYGSHYLARLPSGTSKTLPAVKREDCTAFHKAHYLPNESLLIFSGDVSLDRAVELSKKYFGDWQPGARPTPADAAIGQAPGRSGLQAATQGSGAASAAGIPAVSDTHIYLVDRPDSTQSQIRMGHLAYTRSDPKYVPGQVFNQYFGGGFSSRLMRAVRVKEGLTYGAGGGFNAGKEAGSLRLSTFTKNETTAETVRVLLGEVQNAVTLPPTAEELDDAKSYLIGRFALSLETPQAVAGKVFDLKFHGLPDDYYETYFKQISATSPEGVFDFAQSAVLPGQLNVIVVGKADEVKQSLAEIAPVTVVKPDGEGPIE